VKREKNAVAVVRRIPTGDPAASLRTNTGSKTDALTGRAYRMNGAKKFKRNRFEKVIDRIVNPGF
jgi:hypothetical protein